MLKHYVLTEWNRFFGVNISAIDELFYVGGQFSPQQWQRIAALGVRAVLSLQAEHDDMFCAPYPSRTLRVAVTDHTAPTIAQLTEAVCFMHETHHAQMPVLVHCRAGVGRAPITAAAYLMAHRAMNMERALATIRAARPNILPNSVQRHRLREWEQHIGVAKK